MCQNGCKVFNPAKCSEGELGSISFRSVAAVAAHSYAPLGGDSDRDRTGGRPDTQECVNGPAQPVLYALNWTAVTWGPGGGGGAQSPRGAAPPQRQQGRRKLPRHPGGKVCGEAPQRRSHRHFHSVCVRVVCECVRVGSECVWVCVLFPPERRHGAIVHGSAHHSPFAPTGEGGRESGWEG